MNKKYYDLIKANILIVDNSPENLRLLSSLLIKQGYRVNCVADGEMALHAVKGKLPDLIILDALIPLIDGYRLCQILKTSEKTKHIPVLFISSLDSEKDKVRAFQLGAVDYITKPFFWEEVIVRVQAQLKWNQQKKHLQTLVQTQVTQQQELEQKLSQSKVLLSGVLNSSLDGVAVFECIRDKWGKIIDFRWLVSNPVATMTVGETKDSLEGKELYKQLNLTGHLFEGLFNLFVQVVENCTVLNKEHYYKTDNAWFHIVAVKLNDGFAMTFRDITERKQMEITLREVNEELERQANIDSLTQVSNRRRFDEYLTQEWSRCTREKEYLSLIFCDVDYFKLYNDAYGHQAGDRCLFEVAQGMELIIKRPADVVFRYGGEEFAVILPFTEGEGALKVAQEIKQAISQLKIPHHISEVSEYVTLSLGVSSIIPVANISPKALIETADQALYEAKHRGRNQVVYKSLKLPTPQSQV